jgi:hypothetical protein
VGRSELSDAIGPVGSMNLYWLTAGVGLGWLSRSQPELELGPRVQLGYALAAAHTTRSGVQASSKSGFVMVALLAASVRAPLTEQVQVVLGLDLGYTLKGIVFLGDQARLSGMADATFALRAGLAF